MTVILHRFPPPRARLAQPTPSHPGVIAPLIKDVPFDIVQIQPPAQISPASHLGPFFLSFLRAISRLVPSSTPFQSRRGVFLCDGDLLTHQQIVLPLSSQQPTVEGEEKSIRNLLLLWLCSVSVETFIPLHDDKEPPFSV